MDIFPQNLKKRVTEDRVEVEGRKFKLTSFDPLLGNYILFKLFTSVMPFGLGDMLNAKSGGTENVPVDTSTTPPMSKADFIELQKDVLSFVFEDLPAGPTPVVRENGTYGVMNLTMGIAMQLLISELSFNFNDFFEESQ